MTDSNKISYRLREETLQRLVREYAASTKNIVVTYHAEDRMYERNISYDAALDILRTGAVCYEKTDERGNDVIKATKRNPGERPASTVAAVVTKDRRLILITVMWDDKQ